MKIKRYTAPSMRAALAMVRTEQGPDAVILSSRRSEEGIEVIAALDYDEALFAEAKKQRAAAQPEAVLGAPCATTPEVPKPANPAPLRNPAARAPGAVSAAPTPQKPSPAAPRADFAYTLMQREMREMRRLIESGMAGMAWNEQRTREPLKAQVLESLSTLDISPDVARVIARETPRKTTYLHDPAHIPMALLIKNLPLVDDFTAELGGVMALVGPTGAGKTTTLAKLATRWCLQHGSSEIALISTDAFRIGAREQLMTFARILDVSMHTANSGRELSRLLERLASKRLILIDTAGMGPRDERLSEQLAALRQGAPKAKVLLALPAQAESQALDDIVRAYARVNPTACVITKTDEAATLGGVLSAVIRHQLKIAYVCDGQKVPDDLHPSKQRRIWLVRAAHLLKEGAPNTPDEAYLARHFGRVQNHA